MRTDVLMPKMGMTMASGIVSEWLKEDGAAVIEGEAIATIETEKIVNSLEAPVTGTLHITMETDEEVPVGEVIGYID